MDIQLSSRHGTPDKHAQQAQMWDNAASQIVSDVCDDNAWFKYPSQCEEMAAEEKQKLLKRTPFKR